MRKNDIFITNKLTYSSYFPGASSNGASFIDSKPKTSKTHLQKKIQKTQISKKFDYFMRSNFPSINSSAEQSLKPLTVNSYTQSKSKEMPRFFCPKKNTTVSNNKNNYSEEESQFDSLLKNRNLKFSLHLKELKTKQTEQFLESKFYKSNEIIVNKVQNKKNEKRVNIEKYFVGQQNHNSISTVILLSPRKIDDLNNFQMKRLKILKEDLTNLIEKIYENVMILLKTSGGNRKFVANLLKKMGGFHNDIGETIFDRKQEEIRLNFTKENLARNIEKKMNISSSYSLFFLEQIYYLNNNLLAYILDKDKEWFDKKTNEIKTDLNEWREKKQEYLDKITNQKDLFKEKKKFIDVASDCFQPKSYLMNKVIWDTLEKNERVVGEYNLLGVYQRSQWQNIQNVEDALK